MIPTLPGTSDIPQGPERPAPTRAPPPAVRSADLDEFDTLKRAVRDLQTRIDALETRVAQLERNARVA